MSRRLAPGDPVPELVGIDWRGERVDLSSLRGTRVWLAFFRYASCPLCNLRVRDIIARHDELTAGGMSIIAVFQSPASSVARYVGKQAPPFPLVCDPEERLYRRFGLEARLSAFVSPANVARASLATAAGFLPGAMDGTKTRIPADFLVDEDGVLADVFYGDVIADHIPFERVEHFARG